MSRMQIGMGCCGATAIIAGGLMFLTPVQVGADQPTPAAGTWAEFVEASPAEMCLAIDDIPLCIPQPAERSATDPAARRAVDDSRGPVGCRAIDPTDWIDVGDGCLQPRGSHVVACAG